MHGKPDPDALSYHIKHTTVAAINDMDSQDVVITADGEIDRPYANDPEGLHIGFYEDETGNEVEYHFVLGAGYWDVDSRDFCQIVGIEQRVREDNNGEVIEGPEGEPWVVLKYYKDREGGFKHVHTPSYCLGEEYGSGKLSRVLVSDFDALSIRGTRHSLKCQANHDNKSLDDFIWMRQRSGATTGGHP